MSQGRGESASSRRGIPSPMRGARRQGRRSSGSCGPPGPTTWSSCLISGGGSALTPAPVARVSLAEKQAVTRLLLECGSDHQRAERGPEAPLAPQRGPAGAGGPSRARRRPAALRRDRGPAGRDRLRADCARSHDLRRRAGGAGPLRSPRPGASGGAGASRGRGAGRGRRTRRSRATRRWPGSRTWSSGTTGSSWTRRWRRRARLGLAPCLLTRAPPGRGARGVPRVRGRLDEIARTGSPVGRPACVIAGGRDHGDRPGRGTGGRCQEFALALVPELAAMRDVVVLAAGTDGIDGPTDAAGAVVDPTTLARARAKGLDVERRPRRERLPRLLRRAGRSGRDRADRIEPHGPLPRCGRLKSGTASATCASV